MPVQSKMCLEAELHNPHAAIQPSDLTFAFPHRPPDKGETSPSKIKNLIVGKESIDRKPVDVLLRDPEQGKRRLVCKQNAMEIISHNNPLRGISQKCCQLG